MVGSKGGGGLWWGLGGQGDGMVGFLPQPSHPTTHTPLLPSPFRPLSLDSTTLDGHLLIQKK